MIRPSNRTGCGPRARLVSVSELENLGSNWLSMSAESKPLSATSATVQRQSAFTAKALIFGLAGALGIASVDNFNTDFIRSPMLIGNHLPTGPLALIMLLGVLWNPVVGRLCKPLLFNPKEMTVSLVLMMMCCWMPASGFYRYFQRMIAVPVVIESSKPNWQDQHTLDKIPERLFPLLRNPERYALVAALEQSAIADQPVRQVLSVIEPGALVPEELPADSAARVLDATRTRVTQQALNDAAWAPAKSLADSLTVVVPVVADQTAYAQGFRAVREKYQALIPAARRESERVYGGFIQGLSVGDKKTSMLDMPWSAWLAPMAYWAPLMLLFMVCIVAMSLVVHRQWSRHEQLSYPLATVTTALVERDEGRFIPNILRSKLFWWGFVPVLILHMNNYGAVWFPSYLPKIELSWGFGAEFKTMFPVMNNVGDPWVSWGRISFLLVGLSYFISSEMSLSMGLSSIALLLVNVQVFKASGGSVDQDSARAGAYLAYAAILLYAGRTYYWMVLRKALIFGRLEEADREPVWAARIFILGFAGFVMLLAGPFGMDWFISLLFALTVMLLFLVFTRIICETGSPFMQCGWYPGTLLASTLGFSALGSVPLVMVMYLSPMLTQDPREALMPYVQNGLKMAENTGVKRFPLAWIGFGAMAIALVVCFVSWTTGIYQHGSFADGWANNSVPNMHLDAATRGLTEMADTGRTAAADAANGLAKIGQISAIGHTAALSWFAFGAGAVVLLSVLRFSFSWWPLHPVLLLVWGTYPALCSWPSFMLGWVIKLLIVRFAGGKSYNQLKPLFLGVILGEIFAIAVIIAVGFLYYSVTGIQPKTYWILFG